MSFNPSKQIAARYLFSRRKEAFIFIITLISILGVAIGVIVINMAMAIMTGFEYELRNKILDAEAHVTIKKLGGKISEWRELEQEVHRLPEVSAVSAFTYNQAMIRSNNSATGVLVRGIEQGSSTATQLRKYLDDDPDSESMLYEPQMVKTVRPNGKEDQVLLPSIIIGKELSMTLNILPGDLIALISPQVGSTPLGLVPKYKRFVVAGVYSSGLVNYENTLMYMGLEAAQSFFRLGDNVTGIEVRLNDIDRAPQVAQTILGDIGANAGFYTQDWTTVNKPLWDAIQLEKKVYFLVLLLIVVMASFSIVSTLVLLVLEKRGDIAILRTLGASTKDVAKIFIYQGGMIGGVGTLLGLLLGYIACILLDIYGFPLDERIFPISQVPVRIEFINFAVVGIASFLICLLATIYPARKASRLDPASVLRYE
ncbi:MAG: FtsX-like permease family protein [Deltaproteobacteria bacterium]|nr:FtsX-like permease family protein [Deltaproteobacteria bacterium]